MHHRILNSNIFNRMTAIRDFSRHKCTNSPQSDFQNFVAKFIGGQITLDKNDTNGVAVISVDYKEKKNAISGSMMCDLNDIVLDLESWQCGKAVIFKGENGNFCSGGDLETVKRILTHDLGHKMSCFMGHTLQRFSQLPMISVALVEGVALGGGAELAMSCDFMVMSDKARFGFVQSKMGLITGWGCGTRLVRKFGSSKALDVFASGRVMDAIECKRLGFANEIFPQSDNMLNLTRSWLEQYCNADKTVIRNLKSMVSNAAFLSYDESANSERKLFSELWSGEANLKALGDNIKH